MKTIIEMARDFEKKGRPVKVKRGKHKGYGKKEYPKCCVCGGFAMWKNLKTKKYVCSKCRKKPSYRSMTRITL